MTRPLIAVLPLYDDEKESYWMLPGYMKAIEEAGGIPVMLPLTTNEEIISSIANTYHGFLFTGGHDVNPDLYGEKKIKECGPVNHERDIMESKLFDQLLTLDKPVLGICRGLQLINVLLDGTLYQDLPSQFHGGSALNHSQKPPYTNPSHSVRIKEGTLFQKIINIESLMVNSCHHQGIKDLSSQLEAVAYADDGLIEAITMPTKRFVHAVQWHPEFTYHQEEYNFNLFRAFVDSCKNF